MQAHYNQGLGHMYLGQAEEMVACFERVLQIDPNYAGGHYHLAVSLLAMKRTEEARKSFEMAVKLGYRPEAEFIRELEKIERQETGGDAAAMNAKSDSKDNLQH